MSKRFISFPSVDQFRNTIRSVTHTARYNGVDEDGEIQYNTDPLPIVTGVASEKIHGSNMGVCYSNPDGFWVQSRKKMITPEKDNAACAFNAYQNENAWMKIITDLADEHDINLNTHIITVYAEWCGGNIQSKSACSGLDKMAIIFQHFKVSPVDKDSEDATWYPTTISETYSAEFGGNVAIPDYVSNNAARIHNIMDFPTYDFLIDFENPLMSQNSMIELVEKIIEPNSPVGKQLGQDGNVGEGIVVNFLYKDSLNMFKVKGNRHAENLGLKGLKVDKASENKIMAFLQKNNCQKFNFSFSTDP